MMRHHGIRARAPRRYRVCTTDSKHSLPVAPNLLDQNFVTDRPNQVWLADITLYLIRVAGHSRSTRPGEPEYHLRRFSLRCRLCAWPHTRALDEIGR